MMEVGELAVESVPGNADCASNRLTKVSVSLGYDS